MATRPHPCLVLALCAGLSGCIPVPDTYHGISAPGGTVKGGCGSRDMGTPSELKLDRGKVMILVDASDVSSLIWNDGLLTIDFKVPFGSHVTLDWNQLKATDDQTGKSMGFAILDTFIPESLSKQPTVGNLEPAHDARLGFMPRPGDVVDYDVRVQFSGKISEEFKVRLPEMAVDGTAYPALDIEFKHKIGIACVPVPQIYLH
jgi:hypothetical protein